MRELFGEISPLPLSHRLNTTTTATFPVDAEKEKRSQRPAESYGETFDYRKSRTAFRCTLNPKTSRRHPGYECHPYVES
jgi:hypothetical protein